MNINDYHTFTQHLLFNLEQDSRVLGLVALGSMAEQQRTPDEWSDHDFFVITPSGMQEEFRQHLTWLPTPEQIILSVRETEHGLKVLYASGHLLEFAVFDLAEIKLARANDYRVLFDRADVISHMAEIAAPSSETQIDVRRHFSLFLGTLLVGIGRVARGEELSGHRFIKQHALTDLLMVLAACLDSPDKSKLDNLDPFRRFEQGFPEVGAQLNLILLEPSVEAAASLLMLADTHLANRLSDYPSNAVHVIRDYLKRVEESKGRE